MCFENIELTKIKHLEYSYELTQAYIHAHLLTRTGTLNTLTHTCMHMHTHTRVYTLGSNILSSSGYPMIIYTHPIQLNKYFLNTIYHTSSHDHLIYTHPIQLNKYFCSQTIANKYDIHSEGVKFQRFSRHWLTSTEDIEASFAQQQCCLKEGGSCAKVQGTRGRVHFW